MRSRARADRILGDITMKGPGVEQEAFRTPFDATVAVQAHNERVASQRMGRHIQIPVRITLVFNFGRWSTTVHVRGHVASQVARIEEKPAGTATNRPVAADTDDEGLTVDRMPGHVVSVGLALVLDLLLHLQLEGWSLDSIDARTPAGLTDGRTDGLTDRESHRLHTYITVGVLGKVAHIKGGVPVQARRATGDPRYAAQTHHILVTVAGMWL